MSGGMRRIVAGLALGVLASTALVGCGGESSGAGEGRFVRLDLRSRLDTGAGSTTRSVALFEPAAELETWDILAPNYGTPPVPGASGDESPRLLDVNAKEKGDDLTLRRRGTYDPAEFNQVRVTMTYRGGNFGYMRASLFRGGKRVSESPQVTITEVASPKVFTFDLPAPKQPGPCDVLEFYMGGRVRNPGIVAVELVKATLHDLVPPADGEPQMVPIGPEARRGVGVLNDRPAQAEVDVRAGSRLSFSYAQTESLARLSHPSALRVMIDPGAPGGGDAHTVELRDKYTTRWRPVEMPLDRWAGQTVTIRFEVDAGRGQAGWLVAEAAVWEPHPDPASVLLISTDTHRGDHLGAASRPAGVATPALDRLAERGVFFEDCFAPTNVTNPSHMALLTGVHPRDLGITMNRRPLAEAARTLAEVYREAGYYTVAVLSTMHLGHVGSGLGQGFDRMIWPEARPAEGGHSVTMVEKWLEEAGDRPLFVWLHVFDAHTPYEAPEDDLADYYDVTKDPYDPSLPELEFDPKLLPAEMPGLRDVEYARGQYKAEVQYLDRELGRLLDKGRFADGLVAIVGDHGEGLGDQWVYFSHNELYPETVHVPLIVAGPGVPAGVRVSQPVTHTDLGRTMLDISGLEQVEFPGRNLLRFIEPGARDEPRFQLSSSKQSASLQHDDMYLLVWLTDHHHPHASRTWDKHEVELYDLSTDPDCRNNIAAQQPVKAKFLWQRLVTWLKSVQPTGWAADDVVEPEFLEQLKQLGYVHLEPDDEPLWIDDACAWCRGFDTVGN